MRRSTGITIWSISSSLSELWVHFLPQLCFFLLFFIIFHKRGLTLYECFWGSFPFGYTFVTWIVFIISGLNGYIDPILVRLVYLIISFFTIILLGISLNKIRTTPGYLKDLFLELRREYILNILLVISICFFGYIFNTHILYKDNHGSEWSGGSIWADFAFHLNVINSFLHGENKYFSLFSSLKSQIYAGHSMSYPFIPDFHIASLISIGLSIRNATLIPSVLIVVSLVVLLYSFTRKFLSGKFICTRLYERESFFTVILFLLCGGIGGWTMLRDRDLSLQTIVNEDWMQRTSSGDELYWFSIICHILLPQRTATYAYPLVIIIFSCLYTGINNTQITYYERKHLFILAGFITGLLPLVHAHSFLVVGIVSLSYCLLYPGKVFNLSKNGHFFYWLSFGIPIILFAFPQIPNYMDRIIGGDSNGDSFIKFAPLWRGSTWLYTAPSVFTDLNFFILWFRGLTFILPLSIIGFYYLDIKQRKFYGCIWLIFIMANLIMFQPWDKDNTKLFAIWMFLASSVSVYTLSKWGKKNILIKFLVCMVFISMIISGSLMCIRESNLWWQFYDKEDYKLASRIKSQTPHDAIFITSSGHIHPVTNLAGRTSVFNFDGWIHSHGYPNMWERKNEQKKFLEDPSSNINFLNKYNISYICWNPEFGGEFTFNQDFFDKNTKIQILYSSYKYKVYDVRSLR